MQHKGCMPELDMDSLYAALPSRNREVWALIRLSEAMGQTEGRSGAVCMQERGALAYQVIHAASQAWVSHGRSGRQMCHLHPSALHKCIVGDVARPGPLLRA